MKRKKLTPKQRVLPRSCSAYCDGDFKHGIWHIFRATHGYSDLLGTGESPRQAWADAAKRLP